MSQSDKNQTQDNKNPQYDVAVDDNACDHGANWSVMQAKEFPNSEFLGVDISNAFPPKNERPSNTDFVLGDASKRIPAPDNTYAFAYQKLVSEAFTNEDWVNINTQTLIYPFNRISKNYIVL